MEASRYFVERGSSKSAHFSRPGRLFLHACLRSSLCRMTHVKRSKLSPVGIEYSVVVVGELLRDFLNHVEDRFEVKKKEEDCIE